MNEKNCPNKTGNLYNRMIGSSNEADVEINGYICKALLDSGSMISTISESVLGKLCPVPEVLSLKTFLLSVSVASGEKLPYSGYVEVELKVPFEDGKSFPVPLLVVPTTEYHSKVPVVVGTNILNLFKHDMTGNTCSKIPKAWNVALSALTSDTKSLVHLKEF